MGRMRSAALPSRCAPPRHAASTSPLRAPPARRALHTPSPQSAAPLPPQRSSSHELLFVAETNSETPPVPPPLPHANPANSNAPPFTVQLLMWMLPPEAAAAERSSGLQLRPESAALRVGLSVMYSDAGFDVSRCGRYLALCELDPAVRRARTRTPAPAPAPAHPHTRTPALSHSRTPAHPRTRAPAHPHTRAPAHPYEVGGACEWLSRSPALWQVGYHLRVFSLEKPTLGSHLQTVTLPNCPFVTSVQFCPLTLAVLIGYGRCQVHAPWQPPPTTIPSARRALTISAGCAGDGARGTARLAVRCAALHQV